MVCKAAQIAGAAALVTLLACGCTTREQQAQVAPAPAVIARPDAPRFGFFFVDDGGEAKLAYGEANSDNVGLMLECAKGSRVVRVSGVAANNPAAVITLASAGTKADLKAVTRSDEGMPIVSASAPLASPVLAAFRRSGAIQVAYGGRSITVAAKPNEKISVEQFFSACEGRPA
jgi:hypothetical protein